MGQNFISDTVNQTLLFSPSLHDWLPEGHLARFLLDVVAVGGATDQTLQALLGWMSPKIIEKYSHVRAEAKRKAVSVFDVVSPRNGLPTKSATVSS